MTLNVYENQLDFRFLANIAPLFKYTTFRTYLVYMVHQS